MRDKSERLVSLVNGRGMCPPNGILWEAVVKSGAVHWRGRTGREALAFGCPFLALLDKLMTTFSVFTARAKYPSRG